MSNHRQRVVVFTSGGLQRDLEQLVARLRDSELVELVGIVVDQWSQPWKRLRFLMRRWGWGVFALSVVCRVFDACKWDVVWRRWHDWFVPVTAATTFEQLRDSGLRVLFVDDVNAKQTAQQVAELEPDLGVIVGGRILKDRITTIPRLGTLNIHKHDATKYRGSPQIGYPERMSNDAYLGVTIHFAVSKVDQGDIVSMVRIPVEDCDDDRSLAVKATVHGMQAYFEAIEAVAEGRHTRQPQSIDTGQTYVTTPYVHRFRFWRHYRKRLAKALVRPGTHWRTTMLQSVYRTIRFLTCIAILPWLARKRKQQEAVGQAPIVMLYYHGVGNGGENWMTLPMHRLHEDLMYLQRHFKILSLDEAVERLRSGTNHETAAVLTFDDGYASCYDNLVPYLNYYQIPGTIFCCANASEDQSLHAHDADHGCDRARLMTKAELADATSDYVTLGSHGNYHEDMGSLTGEPLEHAVVDSGPALERITGYRVKYFSFPFGKKHHMSVEALQRGSRQYEAMFSAYGGYNFPDPGNQFHFQRIANPHTLSSLVAIMTGLHRLRPFYVDRPPEYGDVQASGSESVPRAA